MNPANRDGRLNCLHQTQNCEWSWRSAANPNVIMTTGIYDHDPMETLITVKLELTLTIRSN
jgi:hypothetical protein